MTKRVPLLEKHKKIGAKIINFGGFEMPVQYQGIKQEHNAVREAVGLFDVSHMGEFFVSGPEALDLIQKISVNDASKLYPGKAQYSVMCYEDGGIVDDLLVYMFKENSYMLVVNAANIKKDREWIVSNNTFDAIIEDRSEHIVLLALQGPKAPELLSQLTELNPEEIGFYSFKKGSVADQQDVIVSATGYTGEKGFELYIDTAVSDPVPVWDALMDIGKGYGLQPAGLGARDTLRLEMGFALYGNDITADTTPLEGGLGWLTKFYKGEFIGYNALLKQKKAGINRTLTGFKIEESRRIPRSGYDICNSKGIKTGTVTSGTQSVSLGIGIGMGYLPVEDAVEGNTVYISIRKKLIPAIVTKPPFLKK